MTRAYVDPDRDTVQRRTARAIAMKEEALARGHLSPQGRALIEAELRALKRDQAIEERLRSATRNLGRRPS